MIFTNINVPVTKWQTQRKVFPSLNSGKKYIKKDIIAPKINVLPINKSNGPISRNVKNRSPKPSEEHRRDQNFLDEILGQIDSSVLHPKQYLNGLGTKKRSNLTKVKKVLYNKCKGFIR